MSSTSAASLFQVNGLIAVVTGGGTGIGLMMAQALEENGAKVYIIGRRLEVLEKAAKTAKHGKIIPLKGDVTSKDDLQAIVDHITKEDGFINVLIANSGVTGPTLQGLPPNASISALRDFLWNIDAAEFTNTIHINTTVGPRLPPPGGVIIRFALQNLSWKSKAVFLTSVAFLNLLDAGNSKDNNPSGQSSQIIATSSIGAFNRIPLAGFAYGASKAATVHLLKQLSSFLGPHHIRANIIAPGLYPSEMADDLVKHMTGPDGLIPQKIIPAGRAGSKEDMAGAILYLVSRAGAYVNGNVLVSDGGRLGVVPSTY